MAESERSPTPEDNTDDQDREATTSKVHDISGTIISVAVWIGIIAGVLYAIFRSDRADVFLNVITTDHLAVEGTVTFQGGPIANGVVQIVIENAKSKRYLGSAVSPILGTGNFKSESQNLLDKTNLPEPLRLTAKFIGQYPDKDGKTLKPVSGEQTVYINFTPPLGKQSLSIVTAIVILLMVILILLFTGDLTRRKARALFSVTYFMTFLSLSVPIAVTLLVSQNLYLVEMMEDAPIGLIKGTAKGVIDPQWLLNIGGAVRKPQRISQAQQSAEAKETAPSTEEKAAGTSLDREKSYSVGDIGVRRPLGEASIVGGLAVPFYVVILAMLGAGINMTRSVPKIQQDYDVSGLAQATRPMWKTTLTFFSSAQEPVSTLAQRKAASDIRKGLIESYMYLLSAPFLAITVYYLLQVVAESVAGPVLVLMAFATGLISDTIVSWIIEFARKTLKGDSEGNGGGHNNVQPNAAQQPQ